MSSPPRSMSVVRGFCHWTGCGGQTTSWSRPFLPPTTEAEGLDFSNYTEPGKYFVLFPGDGIEGTRDLMLIGTPGGSFSLELGELR